ncbi:MAG: hypothetical protein GYB65_09140, partial [Chloroflexi bacterium]|nr:hypothetical protein [Chloroflexota bacterium]
MTDTQPPPGERHGAGIYEMLWDCRFCGTPKLLGVTHRHCPNCGAAQDPSQRYFPAEEDMVALHDHQYVGADKVCPACQQPNSAANTYCTECGADLATGEIAPSHGQRAVPDTGAAELQQDAGAESVQAGIVSPTTSTPASPPQPVFLGLTRTHLLIGGLIALALVIIGGIVFAITYRRTVQGEVSDMTWERVIEIEAFGPVQGEDWQDAMPSDAYGEDCTERQSGSERVEVGSREVCEDVDQQDGSLERVCH